MSERTKGDWQQVQVWKTGCGQIFNSVHSPEKCAGESCTVHNPSDHHMREWYTHFRCGPFDLGAFTERICPEHGVGHPDPDDPFAPEEHGCCGCCVPSRQTEENNE